MTQRSIPKNLPKRNKICPQKDLWRMFAAAWITAKNGEKPRCPSIEWLRNGNSYSERQGPQQRWHTAWTGYKQHPSRSQMQKYFLHDPIYKTSRAKKRNLRKKKNEVRQWLLPLGTGNLSNGAGHTLKGVGLHRHIHCQKSLRIYLRYAFHSMQ